MTTSATLNAGDEIDSGCLKCKGVTNHTIIAMQEEKIAKVQCNVCGGRHNYRPVKPAVTKKSASPKKASGKAQTTLAIKKAAGNFEKLMNGRVEEEAIPYAMTTIFNMNDMVVHSSFGLGVVTEIIAPNKMELTFNEGPKILICQLEIPEPIVPGAGRKAKMRKKNS